MAERSCIGGHWELEFDTQVQFFGNNSAASLGFLVYMPASVAKMHIDSLLITPILDVGLN